jgi:GGDEF domain-containing protein
MRKMTRFLNGRRVEIPPGYFKDRHNYEQVISQTEIKNGTQAALILLDVRKMGIIPEKKGNKHLISVKGTIESWSKEKDVCYLFTTEGSDEVLIFMTQTSLDQIKKEIKALSDQIINATSDAVIEWLEPKAMPVISQGVVIIEGNGKTLNLSSLTTRVAEADRLLYLAKKSKRLALISLDQVVPERIKPRNLEEIEELPKYSGRKLGNWRETHLTLSEEQVATKRLFSPEGVATSSSEAKRALRSSLKEGSLDARIIQIFNFKTINRLLGHDRGTELLAKLCQTSQEKLGYPIIIKVATDLLIIFYPGQKVGTKRLGSALKALKAELETSAGKAIGKNGVGLYSFPAQVSRERGGVFSVHEPQIFRRGRDRQSSRLVA